MQQLYCQRDIGLLQARKLVHPNKENQIDYKSFVTKVLRSFAGYIGQVNRAGGLTLDIYAPSKLQAAAVRDKALMEAHQPAIWHFTPCPRTG